MREVTTVIRAKIQLQSVESKRSEGDINRSMHTMVVKIRDRQNVCERKKEISGVVCGGTFKTGGC